MQKLWKELVIGNKAMILDHDWINILYYNFKCLPFHQAVRLPIDISRKTIFRKIGKIVITGPVKRGMFSIGFHGSDIFGWKNTIIENNGTIHIHGSSVRIGTGSSVKITHTGSIIFEENVCIGANTIILSEKGVIFKKGATFSWNCQIMDTDTHSLIDTNTEKALGRCKSVIIGEDAWVGNHVIINKGVCLPNGTIVASMSLCNKNYTDLIPPFSLVGGIPAKLLKTNVKRGVDKL